MDLNERRRHAANNALAQADFGDSVVGETSGWNLDGDFWSCPIFWENPDGGDSIFGSFGVRFEPESDKVIDQWHQ